MRSFAHIKSIYDYRNLIISLTKKEIKIKYKSAVLGWLWSLLNPLLLMVVFSFVFTFIMKIQIANYPVFLLSALLPWFFLSFSLTAAVTSIVDNASLIKKAYFPYEVIPLSIVAANLFNFLISQLLLFVFLIYYRIFPNGAWLYLPLIILLQSVFVAGICLAAAALHTLYRDVKYIVELIMLVWFYATPIFYPLSFVPENIRVFFYLNPLSLFINAYRDILLYAKVPSFFILGCMLAISFGFGLLGIALFNKNKKFFADFT
ncbi:MAG: ABC transporter permease [Candidatus Omnitrophica bacterium]|nr:ABC transporter permease [Candidatus Omnitrophota bacterium]